MGSPPPPARRSPRARPARPGRRGTGRWGQTRSRRPSGRAAAERHRRAVVQERARPARGARRRSAAPSRCSGSSGSPTRSPRTAGSSRPMNASSAGRWTRIRDRAQQSWPALPNTAPGAAAAAASRSASANTMLGDLPPSSSVTRLIVAAAPRGDRAPDLGGAGERDLGHVGVLHQPRAARRARPGDHVEHALGQSRLQRDLGEAQRGQRRQLGGLEHHRVAGGQRRARASRRRSSAGSSRARSGRRRRAARAPSTPARR